MKMNKIIIPAAMLAVGVALVGSVSSTLAWYQYSTKAQAAFIGTSVGESENLEIKIKDGSNFKWVTNAKSTDIAQLVKEGYGTNVLPVTPYVAVANGNLDETEALPNQFYNSVETGIGGRATYGSRYAKNENIVQFELELRYRKTSYGNGNDALLAKQVNLVDLTIVDTAGENGTTKDLYKAIRVHFKTGSQEENNLKYSLFARDNDHNTEKVTTNTYGPMDTDSDGKIDTAFGYEWDENLGADVIYGVENSRQVAFNAAKQNGINREIGKIKADETLKVTVTIWIEGWQKLTGVPSDNKEAKGWKKANNAKYIFAEEPWNHDFSTNPGVAVDDLYLDSANHKLYQCLDISALNDENNWQDLSATSGAANPSATAQDGDYYINTSNNALFVFEEHEDGSAIWDPATYINKQFKVGMRFSAEDIA